MTDASITSLRERHLPHALAAVEHELILAKRVRDACEIDESSKVSLRTLEPTFRETNDARTARPSWQSAVHTVAHRLEDGGDGGTAKELLSSLSDYPAVGMDEQLSVLEEVKRFIEGTLSDVVSLEATDEEHFARPAASDSRDPRSVERPPENAFMVWRLRDLCGITNQTELAKKLREQGVSATQGTVSRWLKHVDRYLVAGNVLPQIDGLSSQPQSVDPNIIDMGQRQDRRAHRQRARRDSDD